MTWSMLDNGICAVVQQTQFVKVSSGQSSLYAIDNFGRLFGWGFAYHPALGIDLIPSGLDLEMPSSVDVANNAGQYYPVQIQTKEDWVDVQTGELVSMFMDSEGHLFVVGFATLFGLAGNSPPTTLYIWSNIDSVWHPEVDGEIVTPHQINDIQWSKYALGWYHVIAIDTNGDCFIWGANYSNTLGDPMFGVDELVVDPVLMTWLPSGIKYISADYACSAVVTDDDVVYIWGDFHSDIGNIPIPTILPLSLPIGVTIVQIACDYSGVAVLLSNGDLYAMGFTVACVPDPFLSLDLVLIPGGHFFVQVDMDNFGIAALDNMGQLWSWGTSGGAFIISRNNSFCDQFSLEEPVFVASDFIGQNNWTLFDLGGSTAVLLKQDGHFYTYGDNNNGSLGTNDPFLLESCAPAMCDPVRDKNDNDAYLTQIGQNIFAQTLISTAPLPQTMAHDPCGHWHVRLFDADSLIGELPLNCYNISLAIDVDNVIVFLTGRVFPHDYIVLSYDTSNSVITILDVGDSLLYPEAPNAVATNFGITVVAGPAQSVAGTRLDPDYGLSNILITTFFAGSMIPYLYSSDVSESMSNRICITDNSYIFAILPNGSDYTVFRSTDTGLSFDAVGLTIPARHVEIIVDGTDLYVIYLHITDPEILVKKSTDFGDNWTDYGSTEVSATVITFRSRLDDVGILFVCTPEDDLTATIYFTNDGIVWEFFDCLLNQSQFETFDDKLIQLGFEQFQKIEGVTTSTDDWIIIPELDADVNLPDLVSYNSIVAHSHLQLFTNTNGVPQIAFLLSTDFGNSWHKIGLPVIFNLDEESMLAGGDNPVWPFVKQRNIF